VEAAGSGNNAYSLTTSDTVSALESSLSSLLLTDATDLTAALATLPPAWNSHPEPDGRNGTLRSP